MFGFWRVRRAQRFVIKLEVGPWLSDQSVLIPYPIPHHHQRVQDLIWKSDGRVISSLGYVIIEHATHATITATIDTQPSIINGGHLTELHDMYEQVLKRLHYGAPIQGLYDSQQAQTLPEVDCGGFSRYLIDLLQQHGYAARLVAGYWAGYRHNGMHAWVEVQLPDSRWFSLDPSVDWLRRRRRSKKYGGFGQIGSDRIVVSTGMNHTISHLSTTYQLDILQVPVVLEPSGQTTYVPYDHYRLITQR